MMRLVTWAWNTYWISCMTGSFGLAWLHRQRSMSGNVACVLLSMLGSKKPPSKHHGHTSSRVGSPQLLVPGKGLEENVLVVTDHFTRYAKAYVTKTQTTQMTAKTLRDKFIVHYGLPKSILMDQDQNFESQLVADLCKLMGTQKVWTSPYHPQTNGQYERFNFTLINMFGTLHKEKKSEWKNHIGTLVLAYNCTQNVGTLPKEKKSEWKNHIGTLVLAYNCTQNSATGFSPYFLMFGRKPHLPIDVTLGLAPQTITEPNTTKFVQKIWEHTQWTQKKAEAFQAKEVQQYKCNYDK